VLANTLCPPHYLLYEYFNARPLVFAAATGRPINLRRSISTISVCGLSNVVDIMPHPDTSEEVVELFLRLAWRIGQFHHLRQGSSIHF
jgi:hypothetical protein